MRDEGGKQDAARRRGAVRASAVDAVSSRPRNVLGGELRCCCLEPRTGYYRDGFCQTDQNDRGSHTVCAVVTTDFLLYTAQMANDLITPRPASSFPGLKDGDKWCLCVGRWKEALDAGCAPPVVLEATHMKALEIVTLDDLKEYEYKPKEGEKEMGDMEVSKEGGGGEKA